MTSAVLWLVVNLASSVADSCIVAAQLHVEGTHMLLQRCPDVLGAYAWAACLWSYANSFALLCH